MDSKSLFCSLVAFWMTSLSHAFPAYTFLIPNAFVVEHPCIEGQTWVGVGHTNPLGGGPTNAFGYAFFLAGHQWTTDLCNQDSDGDGQSNGQELGDPDCVWHVGATPSRTTDITHPGYKANDLVGCFCPTPFVYCPYDNTRK